MIKEAYDAGVQQALFDIGITKIAADPGMLAKFWEATKGRAGQVGDWLGARGLPAQYAMAGGAGALGGAGIGGLAGGDWESAARGAGIGALGGLGARGAHHLARKINPEWLDSLPGEPSLMANMINRSKKPLGLMHRNPYATAGLGGAAGLGVGAGINSLMD
jgi:hypothetical protein